MEELQMVAAPEEALTPREIRLERGASILRIGAFIDAGAAVLLLVASLIGVTGLTPGIFSLMHNVLLARYTGADDIAVAATVLLLLANVAALLVTMVGALAREVWTLVALAALVIGNIALLVLLGFTPALFTIAVTIISAAVLLRDPRAFRVNPVMLKELRGRMRGIRAFMVITIYLGLMSAFTVLIYLIYAQANQLTGSTAAGQVGRLLFMGIVGIELILIIFIAPSFTAGSVTGERERKTYDLLQTTLMSSPMFVMGKLESALSYVLLLLLSAIPLQSIAFLFGGVSEQEVLLAFVILAVTAIGLGTIGLYFSTGVERTLSASVRAYTVALVITFGIPVVLLVLLSVFGGLLYGYSGSNVVPAPIEIILIYGRDLLISLNPIATAFFTQDFLISRGQIGFGVQTLASNGSTIPVVSPWITFTIIYLVMAAVLIVLSVRRMRRIEA